MNKQSLNLFATAALPFLLSATVSAAPTVIGDMSLSVGDPKNIQDDYELKGNYDIGLYASGGANPV